MKQSELNRQVAAATGESMTTIKQLGFLLADPIWSSGGDPPGDGPDVIDWDTLQASRREPIGRRPHYETACV